MKTDKLEKYLRKDFKNPFAKAQLYYTEKTDSTMSDSLAVISQLKDKHREDTIPGTVIMAGYQQKGRGRVSGRIWNSSKGKNLLFTLILSKKILKFPLLRLPLLSGIILSMVIEEYTIPVKIKWPNDLIYEGKRKLAGILCESHGDYTLVGIGLNCNEEFNVSSQKYNPVSLREILHREVDLFKLLERILYKFKEYLKKNNSKNSGWIDDLNSRLLGINKRVKYKRGIMEKYEGDAVLKGIDHDGALLLENEKEEIFRLISGEIELL